MSGSTVYTGGEPAGIEAGSICHANTEHGRGSYLVVLAVQLLSPEQLHRARQLGALALGLRPGDLCQPASLGFGAC